MSIVYTHYTGNTVPHDILQQCSSLFSNHYGCWALDAPLRPGSRIKMGAGTLAQQLLNNDHQGVVVASQQEDFVGHVCYAQYDDVLWVTQLVVHSDYRRRGIAGNLIKELMNFLPEPLVFGVASANRHTIDIIRGYCHEQDLLLSPELLKTNVEYLRRKTVVDNVRINTQFYIDHQGDNNLPSGWEYAYAGVRRSKAAALTCDICKDDLPPPVDRECMRCSWCR